MAGTIIADFIRADANKFSINVGNTIVASVNALGILSNTGNVMISSAGAITANNISVGRIVTPSVMPTGSVLQVVQTVYTTKSSTTSTSWATLFSASITPTSLSSKILVGVSFSGSHTNNYSGLVRVLRDSTGIGGGSGGGSYEANNWFNIRSSNDYYIETYYASHLDSPATTSPITYNVQWQATGGIAFYVNRTIQDSGTNAYDSSVASSITLMEISG